MEAVILGFVGALRHASVRVSPPEAADALLAAGLLGIDDRAAFRSALRSTLVKRQLDAAAFDQLFELHFSPFGSRASDVAPPPGPPALPPLPREAVDALGEELQALLDRLLGATDLDLALLVREAWRRAGIPPVDSILQQGMAARSVLQALGLGARTDQALDRFSAALRDSGMSDDEAQAWRDFVRQQLDRLRAAARGFVRAELEREDAAARPGRRQATLQRQELGAISDRESAEMTRLVERLGRRLDALPELRRRPVRRGALDMQRTWRANLQAGGVPFRLRHERPRRHRPQVVALCDVSNSMQSTVRFLLHFLYRLQGRFSRVRSFAFVSDVCEVTQEFLQSDVATAIEAALQPPGLAAHASTNYGRSLERFVAQFPEAVGSRTTLLVLGDARGNFTADRADLLELLRGRARRVLWFNPESRLSWGLGDSAMHAYIPHCTLVAEVRTPAQLEAAIDRMVGPIRG